MELYRFQKDYLAGLPAKFIFSADTGTGKSYMALAHYARCAFTYGSETEFPIKLLILAPAAKIRTGDWERQVEEYFSQFNDMPEVQYYSYEKFSRNPTTKEYVRNGNRGVWREWAALPYGSYAVIADEAHRIANPTSGVGKAVFEAARNTPFFVGLTATPLPNGWISAANYFKLFGLSKNVTDFKRRYCNIQAFKGFPEIVGYYREDELKRLWNSISKPLRKEDAVDLPGIVTVAVPVPTAPQYVQVRKSHMFQDSVLDNPSAYLHALRQSTVEAKLPWLDEFLEGASSNVVVFYTYVSERDAVLALMRKKHPKRKVFRVDGERHELPQRGDWDGLERTVTLAQYQSGSTGVEMTYADTIVFLSPTYSYTLYHQSIGRIERIGQARKMTLYKLCAEATVERDIWLAIRRKADFSERVWAKENLQDIFKEDHGNN